jgi:hypothetical protein
MAILWLFKMQKRLELLLDLPRKKADEKKGSKKEPKKREKGNTNNPKTAKQYRMELEREIRQAEAMDLSINRKATKYSTMLLSLATTFLESAAS